MYRSRWERKKGCLRWQVRQAVCSHADRGYNDNARRIEAGLEVRDIRATSRSKDRQASGHKIQRCFLHVAKVKGGMKGKRQLESF